jgi:hypothetical protein
MARTNIEGEEEDHEEEHHKDSIEDGAEDIGFFSLVDGESLDVVEFISFFSHQ